MLLHVHIFLYIRYAMSQHFQGPFGPSSESLTFCGPRVDLREPEARLILTHEVQVSIVNNCCLPLFQLAYFLICLPGFIYLIYTSNAEVQNTTGKVGLQKT